MKTVKLLMLTLMMSVLMIGETSAMINVYLFAQWEISTNASKCVNGPGVCLVVSKAGDQLGGELNISPRTLQGFFTLAAKTEGVSSYIKGSQFILPADSYINPEVLKSETGISGVYKISKGTYKCERLSNGFYKVYITLNK
jgi:hypothetical protein